MTRYTTYPEVKSFMNLVGDGDASQVDAMIMAASRLIDSHCGRTFEDAADTASARVFEARYNDMLFVDDISSTTDLVIATDEDFDGTYETTWAAADYQLEPLNQRHAGLTDHPYYVIRALEDRLFPVWKRRATVRITAKWGWTTVPDEVREACNHIVKALHNQRQSIADVAFVEGAGVARIRMVSMDAEMLLAPFVRPDRWV